MMNQEPVDFRGASMRKRAFTLVEVLIAVAIMSLLLSIIMVPLRLGFESFHIGKARSEVQQQAQLTLQQIAGDLRKAQFVFPNTRVVGVSDYEGGTDPCASPPYKSDASWGYQPYVKSTSSGDTSSPSNSSYGLCNSSGVEAWSNLSRIDMLQVRRSSNGAVANSQSGQDFIVSYYPRRLDINLPYDPVDNPIVLYRAQIPFRNRDSNDLTVGYFKGTFNPSNFNADIDWTRYPETLGACGAVTATPTPTNRDFLWLTHNYYGEADLEKLAVDAGQTVAGAHTLATPRNMALVAPRGLTGGDGAYVPELSFNEEASSGHRINRVTISMTLAQFDEAGAASANGQGVAQRVRVSQTVELPNAGCSP